MGKNTRSEIIGRKGKLAQKVRTGIFYHKGLTKEVIKVLK
jgi:predicted RNA-binding protein YlqC (UPF0109 family)